MTKREKILRALGEVEGWAPWDDPESSDYEWMMDVLNGRANAVIAALNHNSRETQFVLDRKETEELLTLLTGSPRFDDVHFNNQWKSAKASLHRKIWDAWADLHPEEGPFQ